MSNDPKNFLSVVHEVFLSPAAPVPPSPSLIGSFSVKSGVVQ